MQLRQSNKIVTFLKCTLRLIISGTEINLPVVLLVILGGSLSSVDCRDILDQNTCHVLESKLKDPPTFLAAGDAQE